MTQLRLTNTLTRTKDAFVPIDADNVRVYACGPTVYDHAHIGNARPVIVFDVLFRLLRHLYGPEHVTYVRNITDVDDKINARAAADFPGVSLNEAIARVTQATVRQFHDDVRALGVLTAADVNAAGIRFVEPRATDHIDTMRVLIDRLVERGHAYVAADHVLFSVPSMSDYGRLSKRPLDEMEAGARVEVAPYKRSPLDFVLWKPGKPGEPSWPSPAGIAQPGRPGWHVECSAMAWRHLGETFDIHAGGLDLIFPHHENEIAQSRCCFGTPTMANVWLHNGFVQVEGEKMSKSLGNFTTIRDLLDLWPGEAVRLTMLKTHYRQPLDWTARSVAESKRELDGWAGMIAASGARAYLSAEKHDDAKAPSAAVIEALADDLNTSAALTVLREEAREARDNRHRAAKFLSTLEFLGLVRRDRLGVFESGLAAVGLEVAPEAVATADRLRAAYANDADGALAEARDALSGLVAGAEIDLRESGALVVRGRDTEFAARIEDLIERRRVARATRDWPASDLIRDELKALGVQLNDNKDGTTSWEAAR